MTSAFGICLTILKLSCSGITLPYITNDGKILYLVSNEMISELMKIYWKEWCLNYSFLIKILKYIFWNIKICGNYEF